MKSYDVGAARATADFAPVYPASERVPATRLRELARAAIAQHGRFLPDPLPAELELPLRRDAIAAIHFPETEEQAEEARRRLALDELRRTATRGRPFARPTTPSQPRSARPAS